MAFPDYTTTGPWRHTSPDQHYYPQRQPIRAILRRWFAVIVLTVALGIGTWAGFLHYQTHRAGDAALQAAKEYVLELTNLDSDNIDANFARIASGSTEEFYDKNSHLASQMRHLFVDHKVHAHGHVVEAVVKSADRDHAVILLLVNQAIRNSDNPQTTIDRSRIRMTMHKVNGNWLASKVELV